MTFPIPDPVEVRLSEVISALSFALDITEGQPMGHSVRSCLIGMRLAEVLGLSAEDRSGLFYGLLLKDLGCSSNASRVCAIFGTDDLALKHDHKLTDWTRAVPSFRHAMRHVPPELSPIGKALEVLRIAVKDKGSGREMTETRCERGADIARLLGFSEATAQAIQHLDEHWNGRGLPHGRQGTDIPLFGRIICLAQTVEVFASTFDAEAACAIALERKGAWFDPALVDALLHFRKDFDFWQSLSSPGVRSLLGAHEPEDRILMADESRLDRIAEGFARVIDAKSPYTFRHSEGVADYAVGIGRELGFEAVALRDLRRAALLHDIGKLGVSNTILDKPAKLTPDEIAVMRRHPAYTLEILNRVLPFRGIAQVAASHHERLDGGGYHRGLSGEALDQPSRVLVVADIFEALSANRPYRPAVPEEQIFEIMARDVGKGICGESFHALQKHLHSRGAAAPGGTPGLTVARPG